MSDLQSNDRERAGALGLRGLLGTAVGIGLVLLVPLLAMQWTDEVRWEASDFLVAGGLLAAAAAAYRLVLGASRARGSRAARVGVGLLVLGALLLVWTNLAVGLIGDEHHEANLLYLAVLATLVLGGLRARGRADRLAATAFLAVGLLAGIVVLAIALDWGGPRGGAPELLLLHGPFLAIFAAAGLLLARGAAASPDPA